LKYFAYITGPKSGKLHHDYWKSHYHYNGNKYCTNI